MNTHIITHNANDILSTQLHIDYLVRTRKVDFDNQHQEAQPITINWEHYRKVLEAKLITKQA
jgi:hypothetical protein